MMVGMKSTVFTLFTMEGQLKTPVLARSGDLNEDD